MYRRPVGYREEHVELLNVEIQGVWNLTNSIEYRDNPWITGDIHRDKAEEDDSYLVHRAAPLREQSDYSPTEYMHVCGGIFIV